MRTTPNQVIDSVRALLRDAVLPELQSELARSRLRQVMATLRDTDWDEAALAVLRENLSLAALLAALDPTRAGQAPAQTLPSFEQAEAENRALRQAIATHLIRVESETGNWSPAHEQAARTLAECARQRGRPRRGRAAPQSPG